LLSGECLKEFVVAILKSVVVPKNSVAVFEVKKKQRLRIAGKTIVDFVAFNLPDLTERFDQVAARGSRRCEK
jgi:uncharacterized protein YcgI (DUF1989 family)